jgi:hypothetical protein
MNQSQHNKQLIIQNIKWTDSWGLAQLCVDHMQYSKADYLQRAASGAHKPKLGLAD